jgi:gas vesicle protein
MEKKRNLEITNLNCFLIGAGVGAIVALLFAPKPGKELRVDISDTARRSVEYANNGIKQVKDGAAQVYSTGFDKAADLLAAGRDLIEEQKEIVATAFDAGKKAYQANKVAGIKNGPEPPG